MSNQLARMKNKKKRLTKGERKEAMKTMNNPTGMKTINFGERILPNTMLIDVRSATMKIGNTTQPMSEIPGVPVANDSASARIFLAQLQEMKAEDIHKVILDNGDGFKIKSLEEFTADIKRYLDNEDAGIPNFVPPPPPVDDKFLPPHLRNLPPHLRNMRHDADNIKNITEDVVELKSVESVEVENRFKEA